MFELPQSEIDKLCKAADDMVAATGVAMPLVITNQARDISLRALKYTPIAPRSIMLYWETLEFADGRKLRIPTAPRRIVLTGRGFAKSGWVKALRGLNSTGGGAYTSGGTGKALQFGHFRDGRRIPFAPYVEVGNGIPYIMYLENGSKNNPPANMLRKACNEIWQQWESTVDRLMWRKMARAWINA